MVQGGVTADINQVESDDMLLQHSATGLWGPASFVKCSRPIWRLLSSSKFDEDGPCLTSKDAASEPWVRTGLRVPGPCASRKVLVLASGRDFPRNSSRSSLNNLKQQFALLTNLEKVTLRGWTMMARIEQVFPSSLQEGYASFTFSTSLINDSWSECLRR